MSTLEQLLGSIVEISTIVEDGISGDPGPLPGRQRIEVAGRLDELQAIVDSILDPESAPALDPPDAGEPDTSAVHWNAAEYAEDFKALAKNALHAIPGHDDECGNNLKTIRHCLDEFRQVCGIS